MCWVLCVRSATLPALSRGSPGRGADSLWSSSRKLQGWTGARVSGSRPCARHSIISWHSPAAASDVHIICRISPFNHSSHTLEPTSLLPKTLQLTPHPRLWDSSETPSAGPNALLCLIFRSGSFATCTWGSISLSFSVWTLLYNVKIILEPSMVIVLLLVSIDLENIYQQRATMNSAIL